MHSDSKPGATDQGDQQRQSDVLPTLLAIE